MSGGTGSNNSWTILTSEETIAETLRPLAPGAEQHEDSQTATAGSEENSQKPANCAESAEKLPVDDDLTLEKTASHVKDSCSDQHSSVPTHDAATLLPSSLEASSTGEHGSDDGSPAESRPEGADQFSSDPNSSTDSYTLLSKSSDEPSVPLLSTDTSRDAESAHAKTSDSEEQTVHGEETQERTGEQSESAEERKKSLLAAIEEIGKREEDDDDEEEAEFQVPQRENDSGFSVNKCILGAVILLGLGTVFISGVFMDLDEERDVAARELKDPETSAQQDWLNPSVSPEMHADSFELLNKLSEGNQQISELQAKLQAQKEELKVARGQAAEGAKERLRWEAVEKENSRLKTEMASLPVLQKENNRMKKELETLRSTVTELKLSSASSPTADSHVKASSSPSAGHPGHSRQATPESTQQWIRKPWDDKTEKKTPKKDRHDFSEKKQWKEGEKTKQKDERAKEKSEQEMFGKKKDEDTKRRKHGDERKEKDVKKTGKGDDGKRWKDKEGRRDGAEKQWKEDKYWKKKNDETNEGKRWRDEDVKSSWRNEKDHAERHKMKEERKEHKEWRKVTDGFRESDGEKWERRDWKEKGEKKDFKRRDKGHVKEERVWGERKQQEKDKNNLKEGSGRNERKLSESKNRNGNEKEVRKDEKFKRKEEDWKTGGQRNKEDGEKSNKEHKPPVKHHNKEEHLYGDGDRPHTHFRASVGQPEYWTQQKLRLQHDPNPPQHCDSVESCATAERLLPVPLTDFQTVLQTYLAKAEEAGVDNSSGEKLKNLTTEFFQDGVFVHNRMNFQAFAKDVGDILEDMVEGVNAEESDIEDEMEGFEREVMQKFTLTGENAEKLKGERRKESPVKRG